MKGKTIFDYEYIPRVHTLTKPYFSNLSYLEYKLERRVDFLERKQAARVKSRNINVRSKLCSFKEYDL